ncbi:MAG: hypothetical protein CMB29_05910 [Euryarchaeota archaeon]|mgnify:FL=1|nr:hypothetical protein [Euryarchaeota archaeon]|tara:strand:+ start:1417 stop:5502 length:4086 start_codon:yes stop_codon:yes gene_type:complete
MDELEFTLDAPTTQTPVNMDEVVDDAQKHLEYRQQQEEVRLQQQEINENAALQRKSEIEDTRNKENWGIGEYTKEIFSALGGGLQDTASSLITLPERIIDMATGEMAREQKEGGYTAEWDDWFVNDENPIETKTWWGSALRGLTHYGTLAAVPVGKIGVLGKLGSKASSVVPAVIKTPLAKAIASKGIKGTLTRGAITGARVDLLSKYSQETNALGVLQSHYTGLNIPLATQEHDHPMMKTFKNVVEGMGLGILSDTVLAGIGVGFRKTKGTVTGKFKGSKPVEEISVPQANEKSRTIQKKKTGDIQANGSKQDRARLKQINQELGGNPFDEELKTIQAQRTALKKQKEGLLENLDPDDVKTKKEISQLTATIKEANKAVKATRLKQNKWKPKNADEALIAERDEIIARIESGKKKYGAYKNQGLSDPHQGNANATEDLYNVNQSRKILKNTGGAEEGSIGTVVSVNGRKNIAMSSRFAWDEITKIEKAFKSNELIKADISKARARGLTPDQYYAENIAFYKEMVEGRDTSNMSVEEFLAPAKARGVIEKRIGNQLIYSNVTPATANALDLVAGDLLRKLRDTGIMSREIEDIFNLKDVDGPIQTMVEQLIGVVRTTKMARYAAGQTLKEFDLSSPSARKAMFKDVDKQVKEHIKSLQLAVQLAGKTGDDSLLNGIREMISQANHPSDVESLMTFLRTKMRGGELNGTKKTGELVRQLGMVMTNSVLSGPKTPVRAIMGTSSAVFLRPMAQMAGAALSGNGKVYREALADVNGMIQSIPESFKLFKSKLNSYWSGDIADIKTRFVEKTTGDSNWEAMKYLIEKEGTDADKGIFYLANIARSANDNKFLTYSTKIMAATDDAFGYILGRGRLRAKAYRQVLDEAGGEFGTVTPEMVAKAESNFVDSIFDAEGGLKDEYIKGAKREATLTQDLQGFAKGLNTVFENQPWARPFFLFARTGVNGLNLTAKHTPGFNFLVEEWNDIAFAKPGDFSKVKKYGIETAQDLANARAIQSGRLAMGSGVIFLAGQKFLSGELHGNGPADRQKRQTWIDAGWKPRSIKFGDAWVSYDAFEPFNQILSIIGDIGDHQELMGEEWATENFQKLSLVVAQGITSKSYMAGLQQFIELFSGRPGQLNRMVAQLANNTLPLSSFRNELGKILTPYTRELGSDIASSIRNRNLVTEVLAAEPLAIKYDMLTGKPIKDHDFVTRMFNAFSPVQLNMDYSPGRKLLFDSGFDLRTSTYYAPDGTNLSQSPRLRSLFQEAIGKQNLLLKLDKLAENTGILESIKEMEYDRDNGLRHIDPKKYAHNVRIKRIFDRAKEIAWNRIKSDPRIMKLIQEERKKELDAINANKRSVNTVINMRK